MEFKKKLRTRLYFAIGYITLGLLLIAGGFIMQTDNDFVSSFGFMMIVMGLVRIRNYKIITKDEQTIQKQYIAETDERNLSIINRARSITFIIYLFLSGLAVIVLSFASMHEVARWIAFSMCLLVVIYWIAYFVIRKKS